MSIRIGILGAIHDHVWSVTKALQARSDVHWVLADTHPELREEAKKYEPARVLDNFDDLLNEPLDAILIYLDNAGKVEWAEKAARQGLHIMLEKPMASTLAGADRILTACRAAGVHLMVNWPFAWSDVTLHALELARSGEIGQVYQMRWRSAHNGPREFGCTPYFCDWLYDADRNGAGAFMDYCCYGANMARHLLGRPNRVSGLQARLVKTDIPVDDTGMIIMRYDAAVAVSEGSWTQVSDQPEPGPIIQGTEGAIVVRRTKTARTGTIELALKDETRTVSAPPLAPERTNPVDYFIHCITQDEPIQGLCDPVIARDTQEILEAGLMSAQSGREVSLPLDFRFIRQD